MLWFRHVEYADNPLYEDAFNIKTKILSGTDGHSEEKSTFLVRRRDAHY